jgi:hypothetical protein
MRISTFVTAVGLVLSAALVFAAAAGADAPERGTFPIGLHATIPAGAFCNFDVRIDTEGTGTFAIYDNPVRNIQHYEEQGTITANGKTLIVNSHWNVTSTPPTSPDEELGVFTQRGAALHIQAPGGGIVLLDAGYLVTLFPDGKIVVSHGQFPFEVSGDVSQLCAALAV